MKLSGEIKKKIGIFMVVIGLAMILLSALGLLSTVPITGGLRTDTILRTSTTAAASFGGDGGYEVVWYPEPFGDIESITQTKVKSVVAKDVDVAICGTGGCVTIWNIPGTFSGSPSLFTPISGAYAYCPNTATESSAKAIYLRFTKRNSAGSFSAASIGGTIDYTVGSCQQMGAGTGAACVDGKDNDCDGYIDETDEGLNCGVCAARDAHCFAGAEKCDGNTQVRCVQDTCYEGGVQQSITTQVRGEQCYGNYQCELVPATPTNGWYTGGYDAQCKAPSAVCGDNYCQAASGETAQNCGNDCYRCGDGICQAGKESVSTCASDCVTNTCPFTLPAAPDECHTMVCDASTNYMITAKSIPNCVVGFCGDGIVQSAKFEQCECKANSIACIAAANWVSGYQAGFQCKSCRVTPVCGDTICVVGEETSCAKDCVPAQVCGNNIVEGEEMCDDNGGSDYICVSCGKVECAPYESIANNKCVLKTCASGETLDYLTGACIDIPLDCDPCSNDKYLSGEDCGCVVKCTTPEVWDNVKQDCVLGTLPCPAGQTWNTETAACQTDGDGDVCPTGYSLCNGNCVMGGCDNLPTGKMPWNWVGLGLMIVGIVLYALNEKRR